jgi:hypothetical protein
MLTLAIIILLIMAVWLYPSDEDFRMENRFWNGTGDLSARYPILPLQAFADLPPSPEGATLILIPYLECSPAELGQLGSFINRGGTLILADDYGHGNQVLEYLELKTRFAGQPLLSPLINYKNEQFPRITQLEPDPLTDNVTSLVLNHATSLIDAGPADTLARSSSFSFLDQNGDGAREDGEPAGPLPVISRHHLGNGQLILIADPSLFINSMKIEDNGRFIQNIAAVAPAGVYIDQSHLPFTELHEARNLLAQIRGFLATPWGTSGLVLLALIIALRPIWHKKMGEETDAEET